MGRYRSRLRIIADILLIAGNGAKKTWIMYQANLSYKLLSRYLEEVVNAGFVILGKRNLYVLTSKGEEFLKRCNEYHRQCKQLEEQISSVQGERAELENMLLNAGIDMDDSSSQPNRQKLKETSIEA